MSEGHSAEGSTAKKFISLGFAEGCIAKKFISLLSSAKEIEMPTSRKIWGWFVFSVGLLWALGGVAGVLQTQPIGWLYLFCGIMLGRLGYNLTREVPPQ